MQRGFDNGNLDQPCDALLEKLQRHSNRNLDKFELYVQRNLINTSHRHGDCISAPAAATHTSSVSSTRPHQTTHHHPPNDIENMKIKLLQLHERYRSALTTNRQLKDDIASSAVLLKSMKDSIFSYQVMKQGVDYGGDQDLPDAIHNICHTHNELLTLTSTAEGEKSLR